MIPGRPCTRGPVLGVAGVVIAAVIIVANLPTEADALLVPATTGPGR